MSTSQNSAPLFRTITDSLRRQIIDGKLSEHDPLPSERMIAEDHGVSRMTARRALMAIEAEGLAYSEDRRGRFVSPQRLNYDISKMVSLAANAEAEGRQMEIEVIRSGHCKAGTDLAQHLEIAPDTPLVEYTRLFRMDGHAIFMETEFVVDASVPGLLEQDLCQSTTRLLEEQYGIYAGSGDVTIRMRGVRTDEAEHLSLAVNQAGIELEQVIRDREGVPFCLGRQIWRGELAEFSARTYVSSGDR